MLLTVDLDAPASSAISSIRLVHRPCSDEQIFGEKQQIPRWERSD